MVITLDLAVMGLLAALGFIGATYTFYGRARGWPVLDLFSGGAQNTITLAKASAVLIPLAAGWAWSDSGIVFGIGVLGAGYIASNILTIALRQNVQYFWMAALPVALAVSAWRVAARVGWI